MLRVTRDWIDFMIYLESRDIAFLFGIDIHVFDHIIAALRCAEKLCGVLSVL